MTAPIVIYQPQLKFQPFDEAGDPEGDLVDLTCDVSAVEITVDTPTTTVSTFCGKFQVPGDIEEGATISVTVNPDTDANWTALVGVTGEFQVYDRVDATKYRKFTSLVTANPSLYGTTQPGEVRTVDLDVPVLSPVEWENTPT
jgi:hypothetical protein